MPTSGGRFASQIAEVINRNALVTILLREGFNAYLPVYDAGVDLIAWREADSAIRPIQLKSRWTIAHKYQGRGIWMAFPDGDDWYLAPHDDMVRIGQTSGYCLSPSWAAGAYSVGKMGRALSEQMAPWRLEPASR
jgi:hypothetical protein